MIRVNFTKDDIKALNFERYHHPHPKVQRKMETLWLKSQGHSHAVICRIADICEATLCSYLRDYQEGGIEQLKRINFYRPQSKLKAYQTTIKDYFQDHPPATIKEAMAKIEELTGIKRSDTQVRHFLKGTGMKLRKVGMIPSKADPEKQKEFVEKKINTLPGRGEVR